jgi:hypothetical protein
MGKRTRIKHGAEGNTLFMQATIRMDFVNQLALVIALKTFDFMAEGFRRKLTQVLNICQRGMAILLRLTRAQKV